MSGLDKIRRHWERNNSGREVDNAPLKRAKKRNACG
jgi:hypothetical protein